MPRWPLLSAVLVILVWFLISSFWADSIRHHKQILYGGAGCGWIGIVRSYEPE